MRDGMPHRTVIDGRPQWVMGDTPVYMWGAASVVKADGSVAQDMSFSDWQVEDVHPSCSQTIARVQMMDEQGVWAQIVYPNIMGFSGHRAMGIDEKLRLAATQIYNDALAEMQAESGQRLFGMALLPWWDPKLSVAEIKRCAAMGLCGVNMNPAPYAHGLPDLADRFWDPIWAACEEHGLPVNFHLGSSDESMNWIGAAGWPSLPESSRLAVSGLMLMTDQMRIMANFILSGILDRFETLKVVSVESGIGWVPFMLRNIEYTLMETHGVGGGPLRLTPYEYFRRNMAACFWFERDDLPALIRSVGEENVMFETDFPHPTCLYPNGISYLSELFDEDEALGRKVASTNAARIYNIPI
jgi:predicted TIM-barrel fold metal-dependent hydrolase